MDGPLGLFPGRLVRSTRRRYRNRLPERSLKEMAELDVRAAYIELAPAVLGYLRAQGAPEPEDQLGEVFLQVTRDRARFVGGPEDLRRWVFTIARNRVIDRARGRARRPASVGREPTDRDLAGRDLPDRGCCAPGNPFDTELVAALNLLTPDQREVIVLRFVADLSTAQVAAVVHKPASAVKALQRRALARLEQVVSPVRS